MNKILAWLSGKSSRKYFTRAEIIEYYYDEMNAINKLHWAVLKKENLISLHHTVGRDIRNKYNLWDKNNPYTNGIYPFGYLHPDQFSQYVIEQVWEKCVKDAKTKVVSTIDPLK